MLTTILFWQITSAAGDIVTPEKIMFVLQAAWCGSTKGSGTRRTPNFTLTKGLRATCSPSCAKKKKKWCAGKAGEGVLFSELNRS